jgi:hypothetical protein
MLLCDFPLLQWPVFKPVIGSAGFQSASAALIRAFVVVQ